MSCSREASIKKTTNILNPNGREEERGEATTAEISVLTSLSVTCVVYEKKREITTELQTGFYFSATSYKASIDERIFPSFIFRNPRVISCTFPVRVLRPCG